MDGRNKHVVIPYEEDDADLKKMGVLLMQTTKHKGSPLGCKEVLLDCHRPLHCHIYGTEINLIG